MCLYYRFSRVLNNLKIYQRLDKFKLILIQNENDILYIICIIRNNKISKNSLSLFFKK